MQDNLPQLRDIHLPDGVSAWPPAYGWFVLAGALILTIVLIRLTLVLRRKSKKRYALRLLQNFPENNMRAAVEMSEILRRICVLKYKNAASLFGRAWIDFLNGKTKHPLEDKTARLLLDAPYASSASPTYTAEDIAALRTFCQNWIGENL